MLPVLNHLPTNDALELCMDVDERKSASPLDSIPTEVLMSIICFLPTKDILKFALSSKKNYNVALPLLYCELNWRVGKDRLDGKHSSVLRNIEFLNGHPELYLVVKNLQITEKRHQLEDNTKLYPDPSFDEDPYNISSFGRVAGYEFKSTHELTNRVTRFLPRFEGLTELTLRSITLPRTFYQSIHTLSSMCLRRLIIRHCRLTTRYPKGYSPLDLRLTELTIFRIDATASRVLVAVRKLRALLKLAQCPTLRLLRLDRTVNRAVGALVAHGIPPSIHTLELDWGTHRYSDQNCGNLFLLLNKCKFIRHLELTDIGRIHYHSGDQRLSSKALPYLTSLKIPVIYVGLFLQSSPIDTLIITDSVSRDSMNLHLIPKCLKLAEISSMLDALQNSNVHLRSLKFNLRYWDKEVFYMLSEKQGMIKELSIGYQYGEIDDVSTLYRFYSLFSFLSIYLFICYPFRSSSCR